MKILVTGAGGGSGINTIRALVNSPHIIYACDMNPISAGLKLAHKHFICPSANNSAYINKMREIVEKEQIDVIIPNTDEELVAFSDNLDKFNAKVIVSPSKTTHICNDKYETYRALHHVLPFPKIYNLKKFEFPFIIKPRIGRGSRDIYIVDDKYEAEIILKKLEKKGLTKDKLICEEYLPGMEYTIDVLTDLDGNFLVAIPRSRLNTASGISVKGRTIKDNELIMFAKMICSKLKFCGPVNIQFKEDKNGKRKLIEINPRFSGGLTISMLSGLNLPLILINIVEGKKIENLNWEEVTVARYNTEVVF